MNNDNSFIIKGDICYSASSTELITVEDGYVVCEGGVSAGVFPTLPERYAGLPLHDHSGRLVIPGLTDLHVHAPQYAYRALGMDLELLEWLETRTFPEEARYQDRDYAAAAYAAFVEALRKGPNTRACVFATVHPEATTLLMDLLEASGHVTMVGKVNMDRGGASPLLEQGAAQSLRDTEAWLEGTAGRYRSTAPILTPRFIPACSDPLLEGLGALSRQYGLPVQSHLSENRAEVALVEELCPLAASYTDAYDRFGLLGGEAPAVMAHCIWLDGDEIGLLRRRGAYVAHCPQSNTNLSSGIAPVRRFLEAGLHVGLGSDVAGGCHLSILRAMGDAIQVSKLHWRLVNGAERPLTVEEAFYLGTVGGGSFFGRVGSFHPSYELDAVVIDDQRLGVDPRLTIAERLARVIHLSDDRDIAAKYIRGASVLAPVAAVPAQ